MEFLTLTVIFLIAAVIILPISHKLSLGAVLGYLIAGILLGPSGLSLVWDTESIFQFSEFGVIFLMFVIGLELQPSRLWVLRRSVFGLGSLQVILTSAIIFCLGLYFKLNWQTSLVLGLGLAMSSTALVLQSLAERNQLTAQHGRDSFAVLLFQDLAVIPILAILPMLGTNDETAHTWQSMLLPVAVIVGLIVGGRFLLKPAFRWIASIESRELFTSAALLIVMGTAGLMHLVGLSMALGAFIAGVLLADSEYKHELEADIEPFKGLLLGLFFIAIGMSAKINLVVEQPALIFALVFGLYLIKGAVLFGVKSLTKASFAAKRKLTIYLSQGGEFAFVLFAAAVSANIFERSFADIFVIVVTVSMLIAPVLFVLEDKVFSKVLDKSKEPVYDQIVVDEHPVIIAGFGRFGQIVSRVLLTRKIPFTALEKSAQQVDFVRRFGNKIFFGDASRLDMLHAAKVGSAKLFVLAIDDVDSSLKTAEMVRRHFPHVPIYARARNRFHSYKLLDLGVKALHRDTFLASLEMSKDVLEGLGFSPSDAEHTVKTFKTHDEQLLEKQHAIYQDEAELFQTAKQALADLESLFESDAEKRQS